MISRGTSLFISNKIGLLLIVIGVPLLFFPKINMISLRGGVNSFRIDDIILGFLFTIIVLSYVHTKRNFISRPEFILGLFIIFGLVSNFFGKGSIFYPIRELEYFVLYYVGIHFGRKGSMLSLIYLAIFLNFSICILQAAHLIGAFQNGAYRSHASVIGLAGGNGETANVLNIFLAVFLFGSVSNNKNSTIVIIVTIITMILLGARTPAVITLLISMIFIIKKSSDSGNLIKVFLSILFAVVVSVLFVWLFWDIISKSALVIRSSTLLTTNFSATISDFWRLVPPMDHFDIGNTGASDFFSVANSAYSQSSKTNDFSFLIRLLKVIGALKYFLDQGPLIWLIGTGPGRYSDAMDCGHVRLLVENGIIGYVLFFAWLCSVLKNCPARNQLLLLFFLIMFVFDAHINYKTISLILFIGGYYVAVKSRTDENRGFLVTPEGFDRPGRLSPQSI
jgi:hypothetical protein